MNHLSTFSRTVPNRLTVSTGLVILAAGLLWACLTITNNAQAHDLSDPPAVTAESEMPSAKAESSTFGQQRLRENEIEKVRPGIKEPAGSHIKQEIDHSEKLVPEPFMREPPIQRRARRALV